MENDYYKKLTHSIATQEGWYDETGARKTLVRKDLDDAMGKVGFLSAQQQNQLRRTIEATFCMWWPEGESIVYTDAA